MPPRKETNQKEMERLKLKRIVLPDAFDGKLFGIVHGLPFGEFWARKEDDGLMYIYFPERLGDNPPLK